MLEPIWCLCVLKSQVKLIKNKIKPCGCLLEQFGEQWLSGLRLPTSSLWSPWFESRRTSNELWQFPVFEFRALFCKNFESASKTLMNIACCILSPPFTHFTLEKRLCDLNKICSCVCQSCSGNIIPNVHYYIKYYFFCDS